MYMAYVKSLSLSVNNLLGHSDNNFTILILVHIDGDTVNKALLHAL